MKRSHHDFCPRSHSPYLECICVELNESALVCLLQATRAVSVVVVVAFFAIWLAGGMPAFNHEKHEKHEGCARAAAGDPADVRGFRAFHGSESALMRAAVWS